MLLGLGLGAVAARRQRSADRRSIERREPEPRDESLTRLLEGLPFAGLTIDADGRVRTVNAAGAELFAIDRSRVAGRRLIEVVPSLALERMVDRALGGDPATGDVTVGDGPRERMFGVSVQPGVGGGAIAIAADRTALMQVDRVRRDFIANVSHELRTPLSSIKLMLETVLISEDDAEARALFLPQAAREVERMIRLVTDLLELARSESGTLHLRRERFDLGDVATTVVNVFARRADEAGIELDLEAPGPIAVDADRERLTQVAMNLVDNALRHTPPGGRIVVSVGGDPNGARLVVADTGHGIPYGDLPHIFERFYVVDRSRSREHGGTGLGLSIAKHLVEAHGGTIGAESVFGEGATFTVLLPAIEH